MMNRTSLARQERSKPPPRCQFVLRLCLRVMQITAQKEDDVSLSNEQIKVKFLLTETVVLTFLLFTGSCLY